MLSENTVTHESHRPSKGIAHNINQNLYSLYKDARIIQKHMIYVIGLSPKLANKEILASKEYFGQYGKVTKLVLNNNKGYITKGSSGPTYSAYIGYSTAFEACIAILATDNIHVQGGLIRSSFGTTKYCTYFLKGYECPNPSCLFIHEFIENDEIINKDDMVCSKDVFVQQQVLAMKYADIFKRDVRNILKIYHKIPGAGLPHPKQIYKREFVLEYEKKLFKEEDRSKIFNISEYENYFGDVVHTKRKSKKCQNNRQSSEVSSSSNVTAATSKDSFSGISDRIHRKEGSRFGFVTEENEETVDIPKPLVKLVNNKLSYTKGYGRFFALWLVFDDKTRL